MGHIKLHEKFAGKTQAPPWAQEILEFESEAHTNFTALNPDPLTLCLEWLIAAQSWHSTILQDEALTQNNVVPHTRTGTW